MADEKDFWDKLDVAAKVAGAVFIPVAVGLTALLWNMERARQDTAATMTQIAIGVLTQTPGDQSTEDPLRD